jgi:tRNA-dihydrouridine synthase B
MKFPSLKGKALLAPMAGVNDVVFRLLCKKAGCAMTITEMISSDAINRNNERTLEMSKFEEVERPFGIQIFGNNKDELLRAALFVEKEFSPDRIDLNMGCPMEKITSQGSGSSLLKDKDKVKDIVSTITKSINTPFSVKIRNTEENDFSDAIEIAKICEEAGACAIAVHPRTAKQKYKGHSNWDLIKEIKKQVSIPVIGNGDVTTAKKAKEMLEQTGCDYVMVGRAAMNNPLIFREINDFLETGECNETTKEDKISLIKKFLNLSEKYDLEIARMKTHLQDFTKGLKGGKQVRELLSRAKSKDEIKNIISKNLKL